jgi:hypothetical protein
MSAELLPAEMGIDRAGPKPELMTLQERQELIAGAVVIERLINFADQTGFETASSRSFDQDCL